jgi:hypothetical protein
MRNPPEMYVNRLYQVEVRRLPAGDMILSIKPKDGSARHDWREFQWIKNQLAGAEREAVELYPAEARLVDTANQFLLYVVPPGVRFPLGWEHREVSQVRLYAKSSQRDFPHEMRPDDLLDREALLALGQKRDFLTPRWPVAGAVEEVPAVTSGDAAETTQ